MKISRGKNTNLRSSFLKTTCLDLVTIFCWILSLILLKTETVGNEFPNLQFYRAVCFTATDPAEGAQGNEGNWSCFDESELVIQSKSGFGGKLEGRHDIGVCLLEGRSKIEGASCVTFKIYLKCGRYITPSEGKRNS